MATIKGYLKEKTGDNTTNTILPRTSADLVSGLSTVATTGSYNDLTDKPTGIDLTSVGTNIIPSSVGKNIGSSTYPFDTMFLDHLTSIYSISGKPGFGLEISASPYSSGTSGTNLSCYIGLYAKELSLANPDSEYYGYKVIINDDTDMSEDVELTLPTSSGRIVVDSDISDMATQTWVGQNYSPDYHSHNLSISSSSGTADISLSANTKYELQAGGTTIIFKTPADTTYSVATDQSTGLMSADDKEHLDAIWNIWTADGSDDTLVNKVTEVLTAFSNFPEASTLVGEFAKKLNLTNNGGQTINCTGGSDTPLYLQGSTGTTYLGFKNSSGGILGYFYVDGYHNPGFYYNGTGTALSLAGHTHSYLPLAGGNMTGHIYLTGANATSSTSNTSQIVFGTSSDNHVAVSSNRDSVIINPNTNSTTGQILLTVGISPKIEVSGTQVVLTNDSRLSNSRPASDVYSWAKASTKPSYTASEVGALANYGSNPQSNGYTITQPDGANAVSMRSSSTSGKDVGIFRLSDDNAYVCNSSDNGYLFAAFDTDQTLNFASADNAAFAVLSDHAGVKMKGNLTVSGSIVGTGGGTITGNDDTAFSFQAKSGYAYCNLIFNDGSGTCLGNLGFDASKNLVIYDRRSGVTNGWKSVALREDIPTYNFAGAYFESGKSDVGEHNANNFTYNGVGWYSSNGPSTSLGASVTDGALYSQAWSSEWVAQIAQDYRNGRLFVRGKNSGTWTDWLRVALYNEIPSSLPASDVYSWAKSSSKPSYSLSEISQKYDTLISFDGRAPNLVGNVSPFGMALSAEHGANRLAFINADALYCEYSTDGGNNWSEETCMYKDAKVALVTGTHGMPVGRNSDGAEYQIGSASRLTITGTNASGKQYIYCSPKKMLINVSTSGGMDVIVEYRFGTNTVNNGAWSTYETYSLSGWSGWNEIPLVLSTLGGSSNQHNNIWQIRLTFVMTSKHTGYPTTAHVNAIRLFADNCWYSESVMSNINRLYAFDVYQNAYFPNNIYEGGTALVNKYASANHTHTKSQITDFPTSLPASDVYSWAKASTKPSYNFDEIGRGNITMGDGTTCFRYRTSDLEAGFYYHTAGDESVVFANQYSGAGWMFVNSAKPSDFTNWTSLTPTLQIKRGGVAIGKLIGQAASPAYNLDVNGTANATTLYENGTALSNKYLTSHQDISGKVNKSGDTMTGALGVEINGTTVTVGTSHTASGFAVQDSQNIDYYDFPYRPDGNTFVIATRNWVSSNFTSSSAVYKHDITIAYSSGSPSRIRFTLYSKSSSAYSIENAMKALFNNASGPLNGYSSTPIVGYYSNGGWVAFVDSQLTGFTKSGNAVTYIKINASGQAYLEYDGYDNGVGDSMFFTENGTNYELSNSNGLYISDTITEV